MDELIRLLNHDGNFTIVTTTTTTTTTTSDINNDTDVCSNDKRQVVATRTIQPSEIIGNGLNVKYVLDPVELLQCSKIGQMVLHAVNSNKGGREKTDADTDAHDDDDDHLSIKRVEQMAFWITIATMGRDADERRRGCQLPQEQQQQLQQRGHDVASSERTVMSQTKKKRKYNNNINDSDNNDDELMKQKHMQQEVYDAYLLSLPTEGPDPCCWTQAERNQLLHGTPLHTQIETTLEQIQKDYNRVVLALNDVEVMIPPLSINGRGTFPSVLWARSMHVSRSFPRSLIDEDGVWWMGRKKYVRPLPSPPPTVDDDVGVASDAAACGIGAQKSTSELGDGRASASSGKDDDDNETSRIETILSVRLGGYRAPVITTSNKEQKEDDEQQLPPPPEEEESNNQSSITENRQQQHIVGSTLGILLPLYDMLDHKNAHPIQWETAYNTITNEKYIRFRNCCGTITKGTELYNNYGPKSNLELLSTYGFAIENNVLDSVEGIVLGICIPSESRTTALSAAAKATTDQDDNNDAQLDIYKEQLEYIQQYSLPHRFDYDKNVLLLGPFSLHRKLSSKSNMMGEENDDDSGGVIPDELYKAMSIIGLEDVDEGPMVSIDEMEILREVLTKKLVGFGITAAATESRAANSSSALPSSSEQHLIRAQSVEAYKDGQRTLLQLALAELDSLMPTCDDND